MIEYLEPWLELNLPEPQLDLTNLEWLQYNPRKKIARWGASLTSLDGKTDGVPDLDSLLEHNRIYGTSYSEKNFTIKTPIFQPFQFLDSVFDLGRSHLIKLGSGGFFPYHRDLDSETFRLIYTISGCDSSSLVWIQNRQVLQLNNNSWYYINTKMVHSAFSFSESIFAVFNVINNEKSRYSLIKNLKVK